MPTEFVVLALILSFLTALDTKVYANTGERGVFSNLIWLATGAGIIYCVYLHGFISGVLMLILFGLDNVDTRLCDNF